MGQASAGIGVGIPSSSTLSGLAVTSITGGFSVFLKGSLVLKQPTWYW